MPTGVVIPVLLDSSIPAAIGYSAESATASRNDGLIKNRYIGRNFIEPTQDMRERSGHPLKFNAPARTCLGKRVIMIDDSLVRVHHGRPPGEAARDAGATEVHSLPDHGPADHPRLPLRRRHGSRRRPDGVVVAERRRDGGP
ncbi:MAG: hypothetical protein R2697_10970 [Ilumatobacteraceae bacterium]